MEIEYLKETFEKIKNNNESWVEWEHITKGYTHCETCLKLDKCWFLDYKKPVLPQHENCHCDVSQIPVPIAGKTAFSESDIRKYREYIFNPNKKHGKKELFEKWGYYLKDSEILQEEIEKQGLQKYISGEYVLGKLDRERQRISIKITLSRKDKSGFITFISGWMIYPSGNIRLTTPYGGNIQKEYN